LLGSGSVLLFSRLLEGKYGFTRVIPSSLRTASLIAALSNQNSAARDNYYRLRQVDFDGQYSFSNAAIGRMATGKAICAYPSPLREFLQLTGPYSPEQTLKIRNVFWQVVYRGLLGDGRVSLVDQSPGVYTLEVEGHEPTKVIKVGGR
jgi:hypothetical protein